MKNLILLLACAYGFQGEVFPEASFHAVDEDLQPTRAPASYKSMKNLEGPFQEYAIAMSDQGYFPKAIFVVPKVPVKLYLSSSSKKPLCFIAEDFKIRRQVRTSIEEVSFGPHTPGEYPFFCPITGHRGIIFVKDFVKE